jgi:hypothetical protein
MNFDNAMPLLVFIAAMRYQLDLRVLDSPFGRDIPDVCGCQKPAASFKELLWLLLEFGEDGRG